MRSAIRVASAGSSSHGVARPEQRLEPLGDRHQQPIAHRVAERVVDALEPVEIEEEHREAVVGSPPHLGQGDTQPVEQQDGVRKLGQRIVHRVVL